MPAVNDVGEPCAGEPHARFDVAGAGNGADPTRHLRSLGRCAGKRHHEGPGRDHLAGQPATAPAPDPPVATVAPGHTGCGLVVVPRLNSLVDVRVERSAEQSGLSRRGSA
jgi:hypothetical protein